MRNLHHGRGTVIRHLSQTLRSWGSMETREADEGQTPQVDRPHIPLLAPGGRRVAGEKGGGEGETEVQRNAMDRPAGKVGGGAQRHVLTL